MKQLCDSCGRTIEKHDIAFRLKIEMFVDPAPPEITEEDLKRDFAKEFQRIMKQLAETDPGEAEDEIHESYLFTLCGRCRGVLHKELRARNLP